MSDEQTQTPTVSPLASASNGGSTAQNTPTIISRNPTSGKKMGEVKQTLPEETAAVMQRARQAQSAWANQPLKARIEVVRKMRDLLYYRRDELTDLLGSELGKVPHEARFEIVQQLAAVNYLMNQAPKVFKPRWEFVGLLPHRRHYIVQRPYGVVLNIAPWNFPVVLALDVIVPALLAGNAVIYKPSEYTPLIAEFIAQIVIDAGVPEGVFQIVHGYAETASALIDEKPDKIAFTGSVATGRKIAAKAGELLIPVTLELGGKDAAIVLEDANIERTARGLVWAGMLHAGQMCISVERVYAVKPVADKLIGAMRKAVNEYVKPGFTDDGEATYGPITLKKQVDLIEKQVEEAEAKGARIFQDKPLDPALKESKGFFYPPTLITDVPEDAEVLNDETFGPVIVVVTVEDEAEAIRLANDTEYGLSASIWTRDRKRGQQVALQLNVGMTSINDHAISISAPQLPWGGMKHSGYGRNRGKEGLRSMVMPQTHSFERLPISIDLFWYPYSLLKKSLVKRLIHLWFGPSIRERLKGLLPFTD